MEKQTIRMSSVLNRWARIKDLPVEWISVRAGDHYAKQMRTAFERGVLTTFVRRGGNEGMIGEVRWGSTTVVQIKAFVDVDEMCRIAGAFAGALAAYHRRLPGFYLRPEMG